MDMPAVVHATATCLMHDRDRLILGRAERHGGGISVLMWDMGSNQLVRDFSYAAPHGFADTVTYVAVTSDDRYCVAGFKSQYSCKSRDFAFFMISHAFLLFALIRALYNAIAFS